MGYRIEVRVIDSNAQPVTVLPLMDDDKLRMFDDQEDADSLADEMIEFIYMSD